jgi:hypothetical protein
MPQEAATQTDSIQSGGVWRGDPNKGHRAHASGPDPGSLTNPVFLEEGCPCDPVIPFDIPCKPSPTIRLKDEKLTRGGGLAAGSWQ